MHIIAIWNTKDRNYLNACNKNWLKELAKEIPKAKWEINYIHNDPYPSALSPATTFIKPHEALKIKIVPWTHLRALTKQPKAAVAKT